MSQCAVGPDGELLPAERIQFYHDSGSSKPLQAAATTSSVSSAPAARTQRPRRAPAKLLDVNNTAEPGLSSHKDIIAAAAAERAQNLSSTGNSSTVKRAAVDAGLSSHETSLDIYISSESEPEAVVEARKKKKG